MKIPTVEEIRDRAKKLLADFKEWNKERKDRCILYRIYEDQEQECIVRYRDKRFKKSELPSCAVPVTGERNAFAIVTMDEPPPAPHGQNAVVLFVWSEDYSFERAFEHFSDDSEKLDWKKILIAIGVAVAGIYVMSVSGVIG